MLHTLVRTHGGKETVYMTDTLPKVKARKKALETSQRGQRANYSIRPALENALQNESLHPCRNGRGLRGANPSRKRKQGKSFFYPFAGIPLFDSFCLSFAVQIAC